MKHIGINFFLLLLFIRNTSFAQTTKFEYKISYSYRFQEDKKDTNSRKTEEMLLFVDKKSSYFVSKKKLELDSAIAKINFESNAYINMGNFPKPLIKFEIEKNKIEGIGNYFEYIFQNTYKVPYKLKEIKWIFSEKTKKIGNYICKEAVTTFSGRNYTAWYSEEIPLSEGPYKFDGLPGLILEIYDDKKEHLFTLNYIKKGSFALQIQREKTIEASMKDVETAKANLIDNMKSSGISVAVDPIIEQRAKERNAKNRNYIEIIR